jgi:hypothetical protein
MARRQQFLVALAVELDRALLLRFRSPTQSLNVAWNSERGRSILRFGLAAGFSRRFGLLQSSGLAEHASPLRRRDRFGLVPVLGSSRAIVFLSPGTYRRRRNCDA